MDAILLAARVPNTSPKHKPERHLVAWVTLKVFLRSGRGHRTEAKVGAGTRRPDAGDEGAPRAHQSACTATRPRLAAPPPRKTPRASPAPPYYCARALVVSRARFKSTAP